MEQLNYYESIQKKLIKDLRSFLKIIKPMISDSFGKSNTNEIIEKTVAEYKKLIPQFPYIGGKANGLTNNLVQASIGLAIYRVLSEYGADAEKTGELFAKGFEKKLDRIPGFARKSMGKSMFSKKRIALMIRRAEKSQERQYPGDWVWSVHKSDGSEYEIGIDYKECGIKKFIEAQGASELLPYLCNLDYVLFGKIGLVLKRTKTLAYEDCCDFRISRNGTPPSSWPPPSR